MFANRERAQKL